MNTAVAQKADHNRFVSHVTASTPEERKALANMGFIHVTGLRTQFHGGDPYEICAREVERCSYGANNGWEALVTPGGEVWIRPWTPKQPRLSSHEIAWLMQATNAKITPTVPASNGEQIETFGFAARFSDPDWKRDG